MRGATVPGRAWPRWRLVVALSALQLASGALRPALAGPGRRVVRASPKLSIGHLRTGSTGTALALRGGGSDVEVGTNAMLKVMDIFGTALFAVSGTVSAGTRGMDVFGCLVVAIATAMGGGSIRDMLLGRTPVYWATDTTYLKIAAVSSLATFVIWPFLEDLGVSMKAWPLAASDTLGIGAFVIIGARIGLDHGLAPLGAVVCAVMTSTFGGVLRDVLCRQPVRILHSESTIYATPVAFGASVYVTLRQALAGQDAGEAIAAIAGYCSTVALLFAAEGFGLRLPYWFKHPMSHGQPSQYEAFDLTTKLAGHSTVQSFPLNMTTREEKAMPEEPERIPHPAPGLWGVDPPFPEDVRVSRGGASSAAGKGANPSC
uniref:Glycine transporter domain-containing protein n=1 Tax=Rhizochromulina marina TaxID=1034831 RepID=A0A7S2SVL8_9STRA|mmetsp:Transcript_8639/g.24583  ORF Transcript_8639/g.24583 Transcript_8639/m.24583 type:complete len:373 (+) Transcript_8639:219-1337(+)